MQTCYMKTHTRDVEFSFIELYLFDFSRFAHLYRPVPPLPSAQFWVAGKEDINVKFSSTSLTDAWIYLCLPLFECNALCQCDALFAAS